MSTPSSINIEDRPPGGRRVSIEKLLSAGDEIAAMPLLDARSPQEIMDDLNAD